MPDAVLRVGGTVRSLHAGSLRLVENVNGRSTLRAGVTSLTGAYVPAVDDVVQLEDNSAAILFKGFVTDPDQRWVTIDKAPVITTITAEDHTALADRRLVSASTTGGVVARDAVDFLVTNYLAAYGVTRDPGMGTGATLGALTYDYAPVSQVMNDIVRLAAPAGWLWRIDENKVLKAFAPSVGAYPCPFSVTTSTPNVHGSDIEIIKTRQDYANRVILVYNDGTSTPATVDADDAAEQSARGIYETVIRSNGPFDATTAQSVCDAYLAKFVVQPKTIKFQTKTAGARAGQTLTVNLPARNLNANFLITEVETWDVGGNRLFHKVTAVEGGVVTTDWKDTFRAWGGNSAGSGLVVSGTVVIVTSQIGRATYFLGGSGYAGEESAGPSVLNAVGYIDVMIDKAAIGASTSVTAVVQCKTASAGAGVTAQVYNVTTAAVVGTGSLVTGTAWQTVSFAVTIASGQNTYRLRMTPNTANVLVFALGYLEIGR